MYGRMGLDTRNHVQASGLDPPPINRIPHQSGVGDSFTGGAIHQSYASVHPKVRILTPNLIVASFGAELIYANTCVVKYSN